MLVMIQGLVPGYLLSSAPPPPLCSLIPHRFSDPHLFLLSPCTKLAKQKLSYYGWVKEYDCSVVVFVCAWLCAHVAM